MFLGFCKLTVLLDECSTKIQLKDLMFFLLKIYPIFYVRFPYDPRLAHNDKYFKPLYYETLKANGFWNYSFIDRSFQSRINITWDKKSKTLTESLDDI